MISLSKICLENGFVKTVWRYTVIYQEQFGWNLNNLIISNNLIIILNKFVPAKVCQGIVSKTEYCL